MEEKIKELIGNPLVVGAIGFVIGLIIGLPILGWGLWPVQYFDAAPRHLRVDLQKDYLLMMLDSYSLDQNIDLARRRWEDLGPEAPKLLSELQANSNFDPVILSSFNNYVAQGVNLPAAELPAATLVENEVLQTQQVSAGEVNENPQAGLTTAYPWDMTPTPASTAAAAGLDVPMNMLVTGLGVSCVVMLVIGAILGYLLLVKNKRIGSVRPRPLATASEHFVEGEEIEPGEVQPVLIEKSLYQLGDNLYDDSFSIDAPTGEFLGECGVGILDTIGIDDPKKASAFEVWLFDKHDAQTVTKVLMTQNAIQDPDTKQRLASKGEPILVELDKPIILETATLRLEARVKQMHYGQAALPANSFIDSLELEMIVWQKTAVI